MKQKLYVLSGPSGAGKGSLISKLKKENRFHICISATTRSRRVGEIDGISYYFLTKKVFEKKINNNDFLEYCCVHGEFYGTLKSEIQNDEKKISILEIDTQGAKKLKNKIEATYIFIAAPTINTLKKRLVKRNTESLEKIINRTETAKKELAEIKIYDYVILNSNLNESYNNLKKIICED